MSASLPLWFKLPTRPSWMTLTPNPQILNFVKNPIWLAYRPNMKHLLVPFFAIVSGLAFANEVPKVLPIASPLPEFSLPGIDGKTHTEKTYADKKILCIIFTSNHHGK